MSQTQKALAYMREHPEETVYAIAKKFDLAPNTLYTAINRAKAKAGKVTCPCCGSVVDAERIDRSVLK